MLRYVVANLDLHCLFLFKEKTIGLYGKEAYVNTD